MAEFEVFRIEPEVGEKCYEHALKVDIQRSDILQTSNLNM